MNATLDYYLTLASFQINAFNGFRACITPIQSPFDPINCGIRQLLIQLNQLKRIQFLLTMFKIVFHQSDFITIPFTNQKFVDRFERKQYTVVSFLEPIVLQIIFSKQSKFFQHAGSIHSHIHILAFESKTIQFSNVPIGCIWSTMINLNIDYQQ